MFKTSIMWGGAPEPGTQATTYEFGTQAELDAFLQGVEAANGWMDYEITTPTAVINEDGELDERTPEERAEDEAEARAFDAGAEARRTGL